MKQKFFVLIGIIITSTVLFLLWWYQAIKAPDPTNTQTSTFIIQKGDNSRSIAEQLQKKGLIRSSIAFFLLARFTDLGNKIQAGQFNLSPSFDLYSTTSQLTRGTMDIKITIPEGWRKEEITLKLARELSIPEGEFLKVAKEGYMFPDTYFIPNEASASVVSEIMLSNFKNKTAGFDENYLKKKSLSLNDFVTIASLVEREAKLDTDRPIVASVILNRLKLGMKLDIDATVQYVLGYQQQEKSWWKKELTLEDLDIKSPYNTYKNAGLPPAPISNPGLAALEAVYRAPETDYLYYISDKTGKIHPAKSIEEHNKNISRYLNK